MLCHFKIAQLQRLYFGTSATEMLVVVLRRLSRMMQLIRSAKDERNKDFVKVQPNLQFRSLRAKTLHNDSGERYE